MKLAFLSPLPPTRSGVAHYASLILPALREKFDLTAFSSLEGYRAADFDLAIYQLGNNPHHEFVFAEAMRNPGVVVLHDLVLHHLIVEMTLARGDEVGYVASMRASHGEAGAAWARGRAAGLHSEMGNFLLPGSVDLAMRSRSVIVHNQWAADRLRSFGVTIPIEVVPHPFVAPEPSGDRDALRKRLGFGPNDRVIGFFGFLTSAKRGEVVLEAFRAAHRRDPRLRLLIVGEPAPNVDMKALEGEGVITTGYVPDEAFDSYYAATDRLVNLRYPSAGETSGTLIRALAAGKPVAVSDYAQFAELPDDVVIKIPFGPHEVSELTGFFLRDLVDGSRLQRRWLDGNATLAAAIAGYERAIVSARARSLGTHGEGVTAAVPLFPGLSIAGAEMRDARLLLTLRNDGAGTIRSRVYGEPGYRILIKFFDRGREVSDRWMELPGDLPHGGAVSLEVPLEGPVLRIYHVLEGIPLVDTRPALELEIPGVQ